MKAERVIGVDVGGTKLLAGVVRPDGTVERSELEPTPEGSSEALLAALAALVGRLLDGGIGALGFGIPATIDQRTGTTGTAPNTPLSNLPLRDLLSERFGLPVVLENDANAACIAEWKIGAGRGTSHMAIFTLGTGVGGGVIVDGRPLRGALGAAGELGHLVVQLDGPPCQGNCTGHGHLESLASGLAAERAARELWGGRATGYDLVERAKAADAAALAALAEIGRILGIAMGSLVNVFNPELIAVGGGFGTAAAELLLQPAREALRREALAPGRDFVRVVAAELGSEAGMVGAGLVAFEAVDSGRAGIH